jgi:hypothetical protein
VATFRDLLRASLLEIGAISGAETPSADAAADGLARCNRWIDMWGAEPLAIYHRTRSLMTIVANRGEYLVGPTAGTAHTDLSVSDGFDTAWSGAPDDWSDASTGAGTLSDETSVYQAGGHSVRLQPSSGTAAFEREFSVRPGDRVAISFYGYASQAGGASGLIVRNTATTNYVTSEGEWQSDEAFCVATPEPNNIFALRTFSFNVEDSDVIGTVVGSSPCELLVRFSTTGAIARIDTFTLTAKGGLQIARPPSFSDGDVRLVDTSLSPDLELPLRMFTDAAWNNLAQRDLTSTMPTSWHYEPTMPNGTLNLWPIPTGSTYQIAAYVPTRVSQFASLDDSVTLPPGYEEMIVQGLALRLCPSYGVRATEELKRSARESEAAVKRSNRRTQDLSFEASALFGTRPGFDIRTGR